MDVLLCIAPYSSTQCLQHDVLHPERRRDLADVFPD